LALSNRISGEFQSPVPTSGQLNPGGVTVNNTGGQSIVVENARLYISLLVVCTEKLHNGGSGMSENRRYNSPQWLDLANHRLF